VQARQKDESAKAGFLFVFFLEKSSEFRVIIISIVTVSVMNNGLKGRLLDYERNGQDVAVIGCNSDYGIVCIPDNLRESQDQRLCARDSVINRVSDYADRFFRRNCFAHLILFLRAA
jgi:hypothetical protein